MKKHAFVLTAIVMALGLAAGNVMAQPAADPQPASATQMAKIAAANPAAVKKGLTWGLYPADGVTGTATVSCQGAPGATCDPYNGDTPGDIKLPVLCFHAAKLPYPVPNLPPASLAGYWSGGIIATTPAVSPIQQGWVHTGKGPVDAYCVAQFGPGWEVAEHHMGQNQGWKFGAYGNVGQPGRSRFWMHVNNQPNGTVW